MNPIRKLISIATLLACTSTFAPMMAQDGQEQVSKSWEISVNGVLTNWSRVTVSSLQQQAEGYRLNLDAKYLLGGMGISVAKELTPWLFVDMQASMNLGRRSGTPRSYNIFGNSYDHAYMGGLGLQFRLTPFIANKYIEPYVRLGVNYMYKDLVDRRSGVFENDPTGQSNWKLYDKLNPLGEAQTPNGNAKHAIPVSIGLGAKVWLNDHWGLGLQGDYLHPIQKGTARFAQLTASVIWRIGGKSKAPAPVVTYVDRPVERIVERVVEKPVEKLVEVTLYDLLEHVTFAFDSDELEPNAVATLDKIASVIQHHKDKNFLIIGMTDAKGSQGYNQKLSERRAEKVYQALIGRGIPETQLKYKGLGKKGAFLKSTGQDEARRGDRKVVIEWVTNDAYWNSLP